MLWLLDMDGVLANSEKGFVDALIKQHPELPFIPVAHRTTYYLEDQYPPEYKPIIREIFTKKGFFYSFEPMPGSIEALAEIRARGIDAHICTTPFSAAPEFSPADYEQCRLEKVQWMADWHGMYWADRVIIAPDKTVVPGDLLIDDKPEIKGNQKPSWEHILYSWKYNEHVKDKRRLTWANWKEVLGIK